MQERTDNQMAEKKSYEVQMANSQIAENNLYEARMEANNNLHFADKNILEPTESDLQQFTVMQYADKKSVEKTESDLQFLAHKKTLEQKMEEYDLKFANNKILEQTESDLGEIGEHEDRFGEIAAADAGEGQQKQSARRPRPSITSSEESYEEREGEVKVDVARRRPSLSSSVASTLSISLTKSISDVEEDLNISNISDLMRTREVEGEF